MVCKASYADGHVWFNHCRPTTIEHTLSSLSLSHTCTSIHVFLHACVYIYIYIYVYIHLPLYVLVSWVLDKNQFGESSCPTAAGLLVVDELDKMIPAAQRAKLLGVPAAERVPARWDV